VGTTSQSKPYKKNRRHLEKDVRKVNTHMDNEPFFHWDSTRRLTRMIYEDSKDEGEQAEISQTFVQNAGYRSLI